MNDKILSIGSCILVLGILLYGICLIITCMQGEYLSPVFYQGSVFVMVAGGFCSLLGIIINPMVERF